MMTTEIWADVAPFEGFYQVSNLGNVKRLAGSFPTKAGRVRSNEERLLRPVPNRDGYLSVTMSVAGIRCTRQVSMLVAEAFIGARPPCHEVHHKNRKRYDNRVENLAYVDGKTHLTEHFRGEKNPAAKITEEMVKTIKTWLAEGWSQSAVARQLGLSQSLISRINKGERWGHVFTLEELPELSF